MGPSPQDPSRFVATFDPSAISALVAARDRELTTFLWILGEWSYENEVPAGRVNPAYTDVGVATYVRSADGAWICVARPNGKQIPLLTFDAWSRQWIFALTHGAYGILRSAGWSGDEIIFTGVMTMVGVTCDWRMRWSRMGDDAFTFINEEQTANGNWACIDRWTYLRR